MEHITDRVSYEKRLKEIAELLSKDLRPHIIMAHFLAMLQRSTEMAYIAGLNRVDCTVEGNIEVGTLGPELVLAKNYVKDKGYRK